MEGDQNQRGKIPLYLSISIYRERERDFFFFLEELVLHVLNSVSHRYIKEVLA